MLRDGPCKDCPERHTLCWGECEKYQTWKKKSDAAKAAMYAQNAEKAPTYHWKERKK